jgi:hypothetical protein
VGSGTNLYPALAMLPLCHEITLWERARTNVEWLRREVAGFSENWAQFWDRLRRRSMYRTINEPRVVLGDRVRVARQSIFNLPRARWEIGTMFFVAESITRMPGEFTAAAHRFVYALKPGAPFVAAFMKNSRGYEVGGYRFPAVAVDEADVEQCLSIAPHVKIYSIAKSGSPLRDGYDGMIVATGRAPGR